ncbi:hypothetical protein [Nitratidesulfovibrio vulgaris]|uniref:DUF6848 family protein n=1 Tax=Nitratidesulfovibrio vulgaris TaxID=881 RepID=UPI0013E079E2|nr:hypothetical protein [Nitratidesulfovibrio vulgaris]
MSTTPKHSDDDTPTPETGGYATFEHSWTDRWADTEVSVSYRFRRPTPTHIKRMQATAHRNPAQAARALILDVIHPDDKPTFQSDAETYPGIVTTMSAALIKAVGLGDLGN